MTANWPRAHDLLRLTDAEVFRPDDPNAFDPAHRALATAPWVVVRHDLAPHGRLPVGVRGETREQRWAGTIAERDIAEHVPPQALLTRPASRPLPVFAALRVLAELPRPAWAAAWGPGGSAGFELATGTPAARPGSDLDLVIRAPDPVPAPFVAELLHDLGRALPVRLDAQVQTPLGAVSAAEYARGPGLVLLRADTGPRLVADPWHTVAP